MSSLLYQNQNINDFKRVNDSMSEKIKQNKKLMNLFQNNVISDITSGLNTEKKFPYNNNNNSNNNEELNINNNISSSLRRNASQSSLSVDLNRFKINPNNFNNNSMMKLRLNQEENAENFYQIKYNVNNNDNENLDMNNMNNNNINEKKNKEKDRMNSLLKTFNPYDIKNYLGNKAPPKITQKKTLSFVNNISPSSSNLQMILYNKKMEDLQKRKNPEFLFKDFYQKESRRMIVEYLKIYNNDNMSLKQFMRDKNINPLVLLKGKNLEESQNSLNNSKSNNNMNISNFDFDKEKANIENTLSKSGLSKNKDLTENFSQNRFKNVNSFKILSNFLNDVNDESQEKTYLVFLSIPRILGLISLGEKSSYIFCVSPTNISCKYGIETYIFKWNDCKNYNLIGYFDLINVENCYINMENKTRFEIYINQGRRTKNKNENNKVNEEKYYSIEANDEEIAQNYTQAINFLSQLVKYRVYLKQKKEGKLRNYN